MPASNTQEVVVFHSALGLRPALLRWAVRLRAAGHVVHTPDLYDGEVFSDRGAAADKMPQLGFDEILDRSRRAVLACAECQPVIDALAARVRKSGARFEQCSYAGSGHHFSDPEWPGYSERASEQMFANVCAFLDSLESSMAAG